MNICLLSPQPALVSTHIGPLWVQAEYGEARILFNGTYDFSQSRGFVLKVGELRQIESSGHLFAVGTPGTRLRIMAMQRPFQDRPFPVSEPGPLPAPKALLRVEPAIGSVGLISLPAFTDGQGPTGATVAPRLHGPRSLSLAAPTSNANPIYYGFSDDVRPAGATTNYLGDELIDNGGMDSYTGWSGVFNIDGVSGFAEINFTGVTELSFSYTLARDAPIAPAPGWYTISADLGGTITNLNSTLVAELLVNGAVIAGRTISGGDVATVSTQYFHSGGNLLVSFHIHGTRDSDAGASVDLVGTVDNVSVKRSIIAAESVGMRLLPGETRIWSWEDADINRVWVVAPVGGAANSHKAEAYYCF